MRSPKVVLAALGIVLCVANLVVTLWRSTIPLEIDGAVERIEFLTEENPGIDDIYVLHIGGDEMHVDPEVAARLTPNVYVSKDAWSTHLVVGRYDTARTIDLQPSEDFTGSAITMPIVAVVLLVLLYAPRARPRT